MVLYTISFLMVSISMYFYSQNVNSEILAAAHIEIWSQSEQKIYGYDLLDPPITVVHWAESKDYGRKMAANE